MSSSLTVKGGNASAGPSQDELDGAIFGALNELLERAWQAEDPPRIYDSKTRRQGYKERKKDKAREDYRQEGMLQDCEFGMILLLARERLKKDGPNFPAGVNGPVHDESRIEKLVIALVSRTLDHLPVVGRPDKMGEMTGAITFFSGEPYTNQLDRISKATVYSANLDAAMIYLSFLTQALANYEAALEKEAFQFPSQILAKADKAKWVENLRDAALLVCDESLEYAQKCRTYDEKHSFRGFTCSPSNATSDYKVFDKESRLFFTWTACESIAEALRWDESYLAALELAESSKDRPHLLAIVSQLRGRVKDLATALEDSSVWCKKSFYNDFCALGDCDVDSFVQNAEKELGSQAQAAVSTLSQEELESLELPGDLAAERKNIGEGYVWHAYRISQYLAIRSLVSGSEIPEARVDIDEARIMMQKLHILVQRKILNSRLDASIFPQVGEALTCVYSLGDNVVTVYKDDAYYPLVVRSLAGLLTRTVDDLKQREPGKVRELVVAFDGVLADHYSELIKRKAKGPGNQVLWSFAKDCPYVFYATQRTLFALLAYSQFLDAVGPFLHEGDENRVAETLGSKMIQTLGEEPIRSWLLDILLPGGSNDLASLPKEPWAATAIQNWVNDFVKQSHDVQLFPKLRVGAQNLSWLQKNKDTTEMPTAKGRKNPEERKIVYETITDLSAIGPKLKALPEGWDENQILPILFEAAFSDYLRHKEKNLGAILNSRNTADLWGCLYTIASLKSNRTERKIQ